MFIFIFHPLGRIRITYNAFGFEALLKCRLFFMCIKLWLYKKISLIFLRTPLPAVATTFWLLYLLNIQFVVFEYYGLLWIFL